MIYTEHELVFMKENSELLREFSCEALKAKAKGFQRYSARTIGEFIRHRTSMRGADNTYKVNNNDIPVMARIFMKAHGCDGFFETRKQGERSGASTA